MSLAESVRPRLLNAAQAVLQVRGYHGFELHDLAELTGLNLEIIRYCFASKVTLATEVTRRYTDQFLAELQSYAQANPQPDFLLGVYIKRFRHALVEEDRLCLCGMLGAEVEGLPAPVRVETKRFFELNQQWLTDVFQDSIPSGDGAEGRANAFLAGMEGAMILARAIDKMSVFDQTTETLVASLTALPEKDG